MPKAKRFTVFEHRALMLGANPKTNLDQSDLALLQRHYGASDGLPWYALIHNGVRFNQHVGVLQVGHLTIEVLPKTDNGTEDNWRTRLIEMLWTVHGFKPAVTGASNLTLRANNILDYYLQIFLAEVTTLVHKGLIKKYRVQIGNVAALKGRLLVGQHVVRNAVHGECFYVAQSVYDRDNVFNRILLKTLKLIQRIARSGTMRGRAGALLLDFPDLPDICVSEDQFARLVLDRKTEGYRTALGIARLLLLRYHPDLIQGRHDVLALMFDMNVLWEKFVFVSLRKHLTGFTVREQVPKPYWQLGNGRSTYLKPDIFVSKGEVAWVLDTKWKRMDYGRPEPADLQQMFAYSKYFYSSHTLLVYPGTSYILRSGSFYSESGNKGAYPCSVCLVPIKSNCSILSWQTNIADYVRSILTASRPDKST